jgi:hypothetical protein
VNTNSLCLKREVALIVSQRSWTKGWADSPDAWTESCETFTKLYANLQLLSLQMEPILGWSVQEATICYFIPRYQTTHVAYC